MKNPTTIDVYTNLIHAEIAKAKLESNGINSIIINSNSSLIGIPYIPYELQVDEDDVFMAKDILKPEEPQ